MHATQERRVDDAAADARVTRTVPRRVIPVRGENRGMRIKPESITTRMPSIVNDVSAILVASTTLRPPAGAGAIAASCAAIDSAP